MLKSSDMVSIVDSTLMMLELFSN